MNAVAVCRTASALPEMRSAGGLGSTSPNRKTTHSGTRDD